MTPPAEAHGCVLHYFEGLGHPAAQGSLSADDFRRLLDAYGDRLINAEDWIVLALKNTLYVADTVSITFDDGLREQLDVALPVLEERGLTASWYVYTGPLVGVPNSLERYRWIRNFAFGGVDAFYERWRWLASVVGVPDDYLADRTYLSGADRVFRYWRNEIASPEEYERVMERIAHGALALDHFNHHDHWLSAGDLRALRARGHVIGFHTHSHPTTMQRLTREQQALEYATSKWILETMLGEPVTTGAWPCGDFTDYGVEWCKANGVSLMWGATMQGSYPYNVPRWSSGNWR